MPNYKVVDADQLDADLKVVADAIRLKGGSESEIAFPDGFVGAVEGISGGSDLEVLEDMQIAVDFSNGDQSLSVPDGYAVKSAIIKKPETLIPENIAKDVNVAGVIGTHEGGGGGSVAGCYTVTFMNGAEVVFTRPVYNGDDCPDPVTQGRIETPLKESTAQYDYTYNGWASADGGTADSSLLKNITEDKTLYAAYSSAVRYYTVTYYDEDGATILQTKTVAYGDTPTYNTPSKEGYSFEGWEPDIAPVIGDASYIAKWSDNVTFSGATWAKINEVCEAGKAQEYFRLGNTRVVSNGEHTYTLRIIGFNLDEKVDGGKAGITVTVEEATDMVAFASEDTGSQTHWAGSKNLIRTWCESVFLNRLPEDLRAVIKNVNKTSVAIYLGTKTLHTTADRVFIPSISEMFSDPSETWKGKYDDETEIHYPGFDPTIGYSTSKRAFYTSDGTSANYWSRTLYGSSSTSGGSRACYVYGAGSISGPTPNDRVTTDNLYVRPCFCI